MPTKKSNPLGPTGQTVAANVKRLRGQMQYKELAEKLEEIGRPIPVLGLRRIEAEERRVDADDLVALALVLGVTPAALLMPYGIRRDEPVPVTGRRAPEPSWRVWLWLQADVSLDFAPASEESFWQNNKFRFTSGPAWEPVTNSTTALDLLRPEVRQRLDEALSQASARNYEANTNRRDHGDR